MRAGERNAGVIHDAAQELAEQMAEKWLNIQTQNNWLYRRELPELVTLLATELRTGGWVPQNRNHA